MRQLMFFFVFSLLAISVQAQEEAPAQAPATSTTPSDNVLNMPSNWHKLKNDKKQRFLFAAVERGDVELAQEMIKDINLPHYQHNTAGETLLTAAIAAGQYEMVEWLCEDAVINLKNEDGETPLTLAIKQQQPAIIDMVLERAKTDLPNDKDETPLYLAVAFAYESAFLQQLIKKGANPNRLSNGVSALSLAVDRGNIRSIAMLVSNGAEPGLANKNGQIPLYQAVKANDAVMAGVLLHRSPAPSTDANWQTPIGETLINMAVRNENTSLVRVLADAGADVNAVDYLENTPLHIAAERGMADAVDILLDHGAYADLSNIMGTTPIMSAAHHGHTAIAEQLAAAGANPERRDYAGIAANDYGEFGMQFSDPYMQAELDGIMQEVDVD